MRGPLRITFLGILLFSLTSAFGTDLKDVLFQMEQREENIKTIQFDFRQEVRYVAMESVEKVEGKAVFQHPNKLRIQKEKPESQLTISNGKKVWVYNPSFQQVWVGQSRDWLSDSTLPKGMIPIQDYISQLKKNFHLTVRSPAEKKGKPNVLLLAHPKNVQWGYHLEFSISTETWLPFQTLYVSDSAKIVTHLFNQEVNPKVSTGTFRFKPPKGVDVIPLN
ncbi:hypothetical protein BVX98_05660 [bacterium F11]|nr:hypothetical protein BVX98_05660 [bacterium F11]